MGNNIKYFEYKPHPALTEYVECFWSTEIVNPMPPKEMESFIPDGSTELVFKIGEAHIEVKDGKKEFIKNSHVSGIQNRSSDVLLPKRLNHFCVRFKLGGTFPFFGIPAHLFANNNFSLDIFLGKEYRVIEDQIFEALNDKMRIEIIENFLLTKLYGLNTMEDYHFVKSCTNRLLMIEDPIKINDLTKLYYTNYKALERKFKKIIGLTPSELMKIKRVNDAVRHMHTSGTLSLTETGYACGYYDQSHFIREFKQITGLTPLKFKNKQFPVVQWVQQPIFSCRTVVEIVQFLQVTDSYVCLEN